MAHMITSTDTAYFGRNKSAWHNLGIVKENISQDDLYKSFGYPVIKEPLYTARMEPTTTYATIREVRDEQGKLTGERIILGDKLSAEYSVLQNSDLIRSIDPLLSAGCMLETGLTLNQGRKFVLLLRLQGDMVVGREDVIRRYILVSNDHTGKESARVGFTPVRVVCQNTLTMAEQDRSSRLIRIRHEGDVLFSTKQVIHLIDSANGEFLSYGNTLDALANTTINQADLDLYVKRVLFPSMRDDAPKPVTSEEVEKARKEADKLLKAQNTISELFQTSDTIVGHKDTDGTVYGAYQTINYWLNHVQEIGEARRLHNIAWGSGKQVDARALHQAKELVLRK